MSRLFCGRLTEHLGQKDAGEMSNKKELATEAQKLVKRANRSLDNIAEEIVYCMEANITDAERNKHLALVLHDLGQDGRLLDMALNPNGVFTDFDE